MLWKTEGTEDFRRGRLVVLAIKQVHKKDSDRSECMKGNECEVWEGMEGVVWSGMDTTSKGKGKEGCGLMVSPRVWEGIEGHEWEVFRIVQATGKTGTVEYAWVCE